MVGKRVVAYLMQRVLDDLTRAAALLEDDPPEIDAALQVIDRTLELIQVCRNISDKKGGAGA